MKPAISDRKPSTAEGFRLLSRPLDVLRGPGRAGDWVFKALTLLFAVSIAGFVLLIMLEMARNSTLTLSKFGLGFLGREVWDPVR
jgi:ABC-type phosphate transport system permease subunit